MIKIPKLKDIDKYIGEIDHLPDWKEIPKQFKNPSNTKWNDFISKWFFIGLSQEDLDNLVPKEGVDKKEALTAIISILRSFKPKHEHKEAGAAYLMSEWFEEPK